MKKKPSARRAYTKEAHEILADALLGGTGGKGGGQARRHGEIAQAIGVSSSMLYKWRQPAAHGSGQPNPLHRTAQLIALTGDTRVLDWLAQKAGGHFTPDEGEPGTGRLDKAANALVREFGLLIANVADAIEDQRVTTEETHELRAQWNLLRKRAEAFVRRCEKGDYGPPG